MTSLWKISGQYELYILTPHEVKELAHPGIKAALRFMATGFRIQLNKQVSEHLVASQVNLPGSLERNISTMKIAIVTNNGKTVSHHIALSKSIAFYELPDGKLVEMVDNPVRQRIKTEHIKLGKKPPEGRRLGTGQIIPALLAEKGADIFVAADIGQGMKNNLLRLGIRPVISGTDNIDEILEAFKEELGEG